MEALFEKHAKDWLETALDFIPDREKAEYVEAMRRRPDLVETESPSDPYLRMVNYDVKEAAHKLVKYWKYRKLCMGPTKAFLPLTISGAMADDIKYIGQAYRYDASERDEKGRTVFLIDSKQETTVPHDVRKRCFFYLFHHMSQDPISQQLGIVILESRRVRRTSTSSTFSCIQVNPSNRLLTQAFQRPPRFLLRSVHH